MGRDSSEYSPLVHDDGEHVPRHPRRTWAKNRVLLYTVIAIQAILNLVLFGIGLRFYHQRGPSNPLFPQSLYSPVQDILKYEVRTFHGGFRPGDKSTYQGPPSKEIDDAWEDLYRYTAISRIPKSDAARLPNKTYPLLGDEGHYVVGLDVFHQLHCLDMIRRSLYPDHYKTVFHGDPDGFLGFSHTDHCIDSIRQSLMCMSDVSAIVWQWNEEKQAVKIKADVAHTCRRFDILHDWAREHYLESQVNMSVKLEDDIEVPVIYA
ncbi:hypothetical protein BDZ94DRAFT_58297 [Collybia nuda]|uniref:Uncharacterized protein n=1 Tax=Collybia nuda TaxID=64659 RepID=A0A9P6CIC1_9AGAR|nr:hypothetical protein BDZ94DRAFT_58297 [Collybia nuda]